MSSEIFLLCILLIHTSLVQSRHNNELFLRRQKGNRLIDRYINDFGNKQENVLNSNALFGAKNLDFDEFYEDNQNDYDDDAYEQYDYDEYYDADYDADDNMYIGDSGLLSAYDADDLYDQLNLGIAALQNYYDYNEWLNNLQRNQRMNEQHWNAYDGQSMMDRLSAFDDYYNLYGYEYDAPDDMGTGTDDTGSDTGTDDEGPNEGDDEPKKDPIAEGVKQAYKEEETKMVEKAKTQTKALVKKQATEELTEERKTAKRHKQKNEEAESGGSDPNPDEEDEEGDMEKEPPDNEDN
eukprot:CAMPEP_0202690974 /NCGR_PEP_ID=MMETSP1385-20130828/5826_1 /ASSEMBLY_ACC=CAM_ASM_000861 /TAXON_ID=933848 /ORGANISM="Elphidium margaritaceum" /LENGTH=293 /DNA_ID=CAMNT_0049346315 /DNA_START=79 /DNA_END=960 /DNA_ORIENTATION=+